MKSTDEPTKVVLPFAASAGTNYIRTVPVPSQIGVLNGAASFTDGFPPDCFVPQAAGGYPPDGRDVNYLLNLVSAWTRWQSSGGPIVYDSAFSTSIGGYPKGAILLSSSGNSLWISTADDNTVNPDSGPSSNWRALRIAGTTQIFTASGTYTPPAYLVRAKITAIGAGGGGGGYNTSAVKGGGGGGGGGISIRYVSAATLGSSQTVTIGTGGSGGASNANGSTGGATAFGTVCSASGGSGGVSNGAGGGGGTGSSGDINARGTSGGSAPSGSFGGSGGSSFLSGGGSSGGQPGFLGGGGGGADQNGTTGGSGGNGIIIVEEFY